MPKRNHQRRVLTHLFNTPEFRLLMNRSDMSLARWFLETMNDARGTPDLTEDQVRRSLYRLEQKQFLTRTQDTGDVIKIELTDKGRTEVQRYNEDDISIAPMKKWDAKWRFVMFDIAEDNRNARDIFRDRLKRLQFFRIQQSVWVHPYDCQDEINNLIQALALEDSVLFFEIHVARDKILQNYFAKKGIRL